jgi:acyl-ACP thioesterase
VLDPGIPVPTSGRTFSATCRARLADVDPHGRVRLDALARFLQDVAIEDVQETGWGMPEHLWFLRRIRIDVVEPFLEDERVDLVTWSSGQAAIAAGRRWSLRGDRGGRAEVDSVWIHLDRDQRPARIEAFEIYGDAAGGRRVSTKLELPDPSPDGTGIPWPLRVSDIDLHGHVNNAVYWQAVEHVLPSAGIDPGRPLVAELDYREPIDLDDAIELVASRAGAELMVGFRAPHGIRAVARVAQG